MKIDIMTLFPEMVNAVMGESMIGPRAGKGPRGDTRGSISAIMRPTSTIRRTTRPMAAGAGRSCWPSRFTCAIRRFAPGNGCIRCSCPRRAGPSIRTKRVSCSRREHIILVCGRCGGRPALHRCVRGRGNLDRRLCADRRRAPRDGGRRRTRVPHGAGRVLPDEEAFTAESHLGRVARTPAVYPTGKLGVAGRCRRCC